VSGFRVAHLQRATVALVAALVLAEILWETVLAPIRPGSSWLALKALPIALLWPALARGSRRAGQWASLLLPFYFAEGIVRAVSEAGRHAMAAALAAALAALAFVSLLGWVRARRPD
jgi:uncharacterized membrane protein